MNPDLELVVAYDSRRGIGKNGRIPWHSRLDLQHFQNLTTEIPELSGKVNVVMMGRVTWESLVRIQKETGRRIAPLPRRKNIVVSRTKVEHPAVDTVASISEGIKLLVQRSHLIHRVFGIGGEQFYRGALELSNCVRIYATEIEGDFECDTFFPETPGFTLTKQSRYYEEKGIRFRYTTYERK